LLSNLKKDKEDLYSKMAAVHQQLCDKAGRAEAEKYILSRWVVTSKQVRLSTPSFSQLHATHIVRPWILLILLRRDMQVLEDKLQNSESLIASAEAAASISRAEAGCYRTETPFLMQHTDSR